MARIEAEMKHHYNIKLFLIREDPIFPCHPRAALFIWLLLPGGKMQRLKGIHRY